MMKKKDEYLAQNRLFKIWTVYIYDDMHDVRLSKEESKDKKREYNLLNSITWLVKNNG